MALAVVTGAPGWLGNALVETLVRGAAFCSIRSAPRRVRCVVMPGTDVRPLERLGDGVEVVRADLRDRDALAGACEGATTVFHGAGIVHPRRISELYDINVVGTRNILDEAIRAGVKRFLLVSSNSPAGLNASDRLMTEDDPPRPYFNYGLSKLQAEQLATNAQKAGLIETVILRPCWFYGPNQPARQTRFFKMIRSGKPILLGRGDNLRSMSYIDNAVQGLLLAESTERAAGRVYWIADQRPYSLLEIMKTVGNVLGVEVRPRYLPRASSDVARFADLLLQKAGLYNLEIHVAGELAKTIAVSIDAARKDLGYHPEVELEEGMRRSIEWCRRAGVLS